VVSHVGPRSLIHEGNRLDDMLVPNACTKHPEWVWHNESRLPEERGHWTHIYFPVDRGSETYGFSFYPDTNRLEILHWNVDPDTQEMRRAPGRDIQIHHIPKNLTPENAKEKLSLYLTFW
jgi:hypothetical protein